MVLHTHRESSRARMWSLASMKMKVSYWPWNVWAGLTLQTRSYVILIISFILLRDFAFLFCFWYSLTSVFNERLRNILLKFYFLQSTGQIEKRIFVNWDSRLANTRRQCLIWSMIVHGFWPKVHRFFMIHTYTKFSHLWNEYDFERRRRKFMRWNCCNSFLCCVCWSTRNM